VRIIPGLKAGACVAGTLRLIAQSFKTAGIDSPDADARALLGYALRLDRVQLVAQADRILEAREVDAVSVLAARRLKREPVARILGRKEFWSLPLDVTPDVLVPRPETETVIEAALDFVVRGGLRGERVRLLDIGTGSGALLLALLSELPASAANSISSWRTRPMWCAAKLRRWHRKSNATIPRWRSMAATTDSTSTVPSPPMCGACLRGADG
jgi:release factor glutamine methyltransferase